MTAEQFCYWLQGYFELTDEKGLTHAQCVMIAEHLNTVFDKVTPTLEEILEKIDKTQKPINIVPAKPVFPPNEKLNPFKPVLTC